MNLLTLLGGPIICGLLYYCTRPNSLEHRWKQLAAARPKRLVGEVKPIKKGVPYRTRQIKKVKDLTNINNLMHLLHEYYSFKIWINNEFIACGSFETIEYPEVAPLKPNSTLDEQIAHLDAFRIASEQGKSVGWTYRIFGRGPYENSLEQFQWGVIDESLLRDILSNATAIELVYESDEPDDRFITIEVPTDIIDWDIVFEKLPSNFLEFRYTDHEFRTDTREIIAIDGELLDTPLSVGSLKNGYTNKITDLILKTFSHTF